MVKTDSSANPAPPKRPMSAFFLYKSEKYGPASAANPDLKIASITQLIAKDWQNESPATKEGYQKSYVDSKKNYDKEYEAYVAKYGKPAKKQKRVKRGKGDKKGKKDNKDKKAKSEKVAKKNKISKKKAAESNGDNDGSNNSDNESDD